MSDDDPVWSWPEERWRGTIDALRTGRSLKPRKWKGGARAVMALAVDCSFECRVLAGGGTAAADLARAAFGSRQGLPRLLRLLKAYGKTATFFYPAVSAMIAPEDVKQIAAGGHEIAVTGWIGEASGALDAETARALIAGGRETLERLGGARPKGFRAVGHSMTGSLAETLRDLGFSWDASLGGDDDPTELLASGQPLGLVEIPYDRARDDATYFDQPLPAAPEAVFDIFRREMEVAYEEGGLFTLTLHPELIGHRSRLWIVEELLRIARTLPGLRFATHGEVAQWCGARNAG